MGMLMRIFSYFISAVIVLLCLQVYILNGDGKILKSDLRYFKAQSLSWAQKASFVDSQLVNAISRTNIRVSKLEQPPERERIVPPKPGGG